MFTLDRQLTDKYGNVVSLDTMRERVRKEYEQNGMRAMERVGRIFKAAELCQAAGLETDFAVWQNYRLDVKVTREQLPLLRKTLGRFRVTNKEVLDSRKRILKISLRFEDHPEVQASYEKKMPRAAKGAPAPKCKIVKKTSTYYTLVCENN